MKNIYVLVRDVDYSMKFCEYKLNAYPRPRIVYSSFESCQISL